MDITHDIIPPRPLTEWQTPASPISLDACFHQLFEEQAQRTPDACALAYEDDRLTYAELDQRANQLAHALIARGIGPDALVGLCLDRSLDMIVGLLGILKAGGAYVPIDPAYPASRIASMLQEANAHVVVTHRVLTAILPEDDTQLILLDADATLATLPTTTPETPVTPAHLAYVIFTSGSTGAPKGTMIEHRQLVNYTCGVAERLTLPSRASYATVSTIAADLGNTCIFPSLISGGTLHIISDERIHDPDALADYFHREEIDCVKLTPSHITMFLEAAHPTWVLPRRVLVMGGEFSHWALIARLQSLAPQLRLINHYGPTETTVGVATFAITTPEDAPDARTVPIGYPLPNSHLLVLDEHLHPVPIGAAGELFIRGKGLARGYLNRPDLTAEKFIQDPFVDGERLYRTGDLARRLPNGAIELLGRRDDQVKIRGYRIELGEIEAALRNVEGIMAAAVLARDTALGDRRLVAYIVLEAHGTTTLEAVRSALRANLPEYMVPSSFVQLEALPLTPNGKVDRHALPAPDTSNEANRHVAPRTPLEEQLAAIWADVFGLERVGIYDNFFDLGGHSLLATRLVARVRHAITDAMSLEMLFDALTVADLATLIASHAGNAAVTIPRQPRIAANAAGDLVFPASFMEESMWFLNQLDPTSAMYALQSSVHMHGVLDRQIFERTLQALVERHEVLRTTFDWQGGSVVQVVHPTLLIPIQECDVSDLDPEFRVPEALRIVTESTLQPFDLQHGPITRAIVIHLASDEHILSFPQHHILADGTSMNVLLHEVGTIYRDLAAHREISLLPPAIQYADYAVWQRETLTPERLTEEMTFWREHLQGAPVTLNLPTDHPRLLVQSFRGARHSFTLSRELMTALRELSQREGVSLFVTLMTAMQTLLKVYTNQDDLLIGTPSSGRVQAETENMLGMFINSITVRGDLSGDPTVREMLQRTHREALAVLAHQEMPFDMLVQELHPARQPGQNPLFQVLLSYWKIMDLPEGWDPRFLNNVQSNSAKLDIGLEIDDVGTECFCQCEYRTDLFDSSTIARMMQHLQNILAAMASNPALRLSALPVLSDAERQQILVEWNDNQQDIPPVCLHELVWAQAERTPERIAVTYGDRSLTYAQLRRQARALAHRLHALGIGPDTLVGLCVERSELMIVGVLGILEAGGAYVPLDPSLPPARLAYMLNDCAAPVLVTNRDLAETLPPLSAEKVFIEDVVALPEDDVSVASGVAPEHLAYVIYTSGSTGNPKGVMISHRSVVSVLQSVRDMPTITADDVLLSQTTISFDVSVVELFLPFMTGARIEVVSRAVAMDGWELAKEIERTGATVMLTTPMTWRLLMATGWQGAPRLKIWCGGEALKPDLAAELQPRIAELWNMYGPTETTIGCSGILITDPTEQITIGRPWANASIYILANGMQPVPIGVPGEICIGGLGVARGYLNRPELTTERFIPDPFSTDPHARLYRSGDLGCFLPDGRIVHLGRMDTQVKVRAYRIELGEIEAVLAQHPDVREAAVIACDDAQGTTTLIGYVAAHDNTALSRNTLHEYLGTILPSYMIPSVFVVLPTMPLTPTGKVDRRALPAPEGDMLAAGHEVVPPRTATERALVTIWEDLLTARPIGVTENFFELGGHSLLAVRLMQRIEEAFGTRISLATLFSEATITELAQRLALAEEAAPVTSLIPIQVTGVKPPFFFVPADWNGGGFYCLELARTFGPDQPFFVLDPQPLGLANAPQTIEAMAALHIRSLQATYPQGPYALGGFCVGGLIAYEMARQLHAAGHEITSLVMIDSSVISWPVRMARQILECLPQLDHDARLRWHQRVFELESLADHMRVRARQLFTGAWQRLRQRTELALDERISSEQAAAWMHRYAWAAASYAPQLYDGPLTLLWAEESLRDDPHDRSRFWRARSRGVTYRLIPGSHQTCVTTHVQAMGEQIKKAVYPE